MEIIQEYDYILEEEKEDKKIVILTTRNLEDPSIIYYETVQKVKDELDKRGIPYYILFTENAYITNDDIFTIYNVDDKKGFEIHPDDTIILNRNVSGVTMGALGILTQLEKNGFKVANTRECTEVCSDKYRTQLRLEEAGIRVPKTLLIQDELTLERLLPKIKFPCVVKTLSGSEGVGVFIAESRMNLVSVLQCIWKIEDATEVIIQEFIESDGDIRAFFIGGEYIAAMKRLKIDNDFRSNFSLGGSTEKYELSDKEIELCLQVIEAVDGMIVGVDFMYNSNSKAYVLEANSSPGTTGISDTSGIDVVEKLIDYLLTL